MTTKATAAEAAVAAVVAGAAGAAVGAGADPCSLRPNRSHPWLPWLWTAGHTSVPSVVVRAQTPEWVPREKVVNTQVLGFEVQLGPSKCQVRIDRYFSL